jgi:hypothetical protein
LAFLFFLNLKIELIVTAGGTHVGTKTVVVDD